MSKIGDRTQPHRQHPRHPGRRQRPDFSASRIHRCARRISQRRKTVRPTLCPRSEIALSRIGSTLDIQGGGSDLIFPHHEFTAAHAEPVSGERRFARHYVHAGMIGWDGHKMSKSRGNLVLVSGLRAQGVDPAAIRLGLLAEHYRSDRDWGPQVLEDAGTRLQRWRGAATLPAGPDAADVIARVRRYLADDLDTPKGLAALDGWTTDALEYVGHDAEAPRSVAIAVDALLGVDLSAPRR